MKYLLAHDLGTTGDKATLFNEKGKLVCSSFEGYETHYPAPGMVEQNVEDWWKAFCKSTADIVKKASVDSRDLVALSISGQMQAAVPVDSSGRVLRRAMIWADSRSSRQVQKLLALIDEREIYRITGSRVSPTYQGYKIAWLKENEPDLYERTYKFLQAKDFINMRLTGEIVTDYSDAVMTNLFDINTLDWSTQLIDLNGIDHSKLPQTLPSVHDLGNIRPEIASELGLSKNCRVILGAGDGCTAAVGAGAVGIGDTYLYLGSSSWISTITDSPLIDGKMRVFTGAHAVKGFYFPSGTMQAAGASYSWIKDITYNLESDNLKEKGGDIFKYLDGLLQQYSHHGEEIIYLPYLHGERSPIWDSSARGVFVGLSASHNRLDLVHSVIEGVSMNLKWILDSIEESIPISKIRVIGGGVRSESWKRILSNILGKVLVVPRNVEEATSMGAAIIAGVGSGLFDFSAARNFVVDVEQIEPARDEHEQYLRLYDLFKETYFSLRETFERLAGIRRG